jgi:hypothetical protein
LIRKEHVRCRYGVFKVRASSTRARPTEGRSPGRLESRVRDDAVLQSSTACGRPSREPTRETRSTCSRRTGSSDDASTSSSHQRVQQPPE